MNSDDIGQLVYLIALLAAVGTWVFVQNRQSLGKTVQQLMIWGLIFLGVIAAYGLWGDIRSTVVPQQAVHADGGQISVPRARDGHYYLTLQINGDPVDFLVDTGASDMVLNAEDARLIGIDPTSLAYLGRAMTANGEVRTARVKLDSVALGPITDRNVSAWVNEGALEQSLLGMGYLQRFSGIEIRNNELILTR
ncbi:retropepsin-like aspartic protease family protein [Epibacterium sp. Ofav1-8]|uniref:retropepsin-like aspartic protease family protein n=1 Tax=Epibacterium sp. Ofav1-8 TaxID=2917735 RepID=UPI001EF3E765|nr:TIGR02281 family clan AA aspartic protease [Epibacterium sp. Ofav1-8]MCG7623388.1 TIGR02281 family clan AA aspartic protease [Epibacterium sp. Ofav1-8]